MNLHVILLSAALLLAVACGKHEPAADNPAPAPPVQEEPETPVEPEDYVSTDFSADGEVAVLQRATEGNGIDIILMGEGYSDRMIADGTYDRMMRLAADDFFAEEPFASFRHLFNVYAVTLVSRTETVGEPKSDTALAVEFEEDTTVIKGDDNACFIYAQQVPELRGNIGRLNEMVVVVVVNKIRWAGTCYPYGPFSVADGQTMLDGDYGRGFSITYSAYADLDDLRYTVTHEAAGHGFAKLADEYYSEGSTMQDDTKYYYTFLQNYGYWRNIDFSGNAADSPWAAYITDPRYAGSDTGYYEGAAYSQYGVWRSSWQSLMYYTEGGFNAISREAAYRRIHKLAYGDSWQFDREKFVEYDLRNIRKAATAGISRPSSHRECLPQPRMLDRERINMKNTNRGDMTTLH